MFPTPLAILIFCAPESPWWLVRKGRLEEAAHSVGRLGRRSLLNVKEQVAMMRRVVELEKSEKEPTHVELFKGTDLYRTLIVCGVYAAQNLTGNLIANQAVYFFQRKSAFPQPRLCANQMYRGWCWRQPLFCPWSHHLRPSNDLRHAFLDSHHLFRPSINLSLGFRRKHHPPHRPRCRSFHPRHERQLGSKLCFIGSSFLGIDHLRSVHPRSCTC